MSRTIRRKSDKARYPRFEHTYTHVRPDSWCGMQQDWTNRGAFPRLPLEGAAFDRVYHKYHTDNGLPEFGFENAFERPMKVSESQRRGTAKRELRRWLDNPDYEIQFPRDKQIYDLC